MRKPIVINGRESVMLDIADRNFARKVLNSEEYYVWDGIMQLMPYATKDKYPLYRDISLYSEFYTVIDDDYDIGVTYKQYETAIEGLVRKKYLRLVNNIYECYERPYIKH